MREYPQEKGFIRFSATVRVFERKSQLDCVSKGLRLKFPVKVCESPFIRV